VQYLRYHIENYYQEVHLLRERLLSFIRILKRVYKSSPAAAELAPSTKPVEKAVMQIFAPFAEPRGRHVHQKRLDDEHLRRLSSIEVLVPVNPIFADLLRSVVRRTRKEKIAWLNSQTEIIGRRVDEYFDVIAKILIDGEGRFLEPAG
jgi:hypothetical protein